MANDPPEDALDQLYFAWRVSRSALREAIDEYDEAEKTAAALRRQRQEAQDIEKAIRTAIAVIATTPPEDILVHVGSEAGDIVVVSVFGKDPKNRGERATLAQVRFPQGLVEVARLGGAPSANALLSGKHR